MKIGLRHQFAETEAACPYFLFYDSKSDQPTKKHIEEIEESAKERLKKKIADFF